MKKQVRSLQEGPQLRDGKWVLTVTDEKHLEVHRIYFVQVPSSLAFPYILKLCMTAFLKVPCSASESLLYNVHTHVVKRGTGCYSGASLAGTPWRPKMILSFPFPDTLFSFLLPFWKPLNPSMRWLNQTTQQKVNPEEKGRKENQQGSTQAFSQWTGYQWRWKAPHLAEGRWQGHTPGSTGEESKAFPFFSDKGLHHDKLKDIFTEVTVWHNCNFFL